MEREIALDTETTGFKPNEGHRIVEIGAVEMINRIPTGKVYHQYINPERDMPLGAYEVHGLSSEFLNDYPVFKEVADAFIEFIGDATLVIHNAAFDMAFINHHLIELRKRVIPDEQVFCTLEYARRAFPGAPASLDALCKRFNIDNTARVKHGALLDAELLADMYLELRGGAQEGFALERKAQTTLSSEVGAAPRKTRSFPVTEAEKAAHLAFLEAHIPDALWKA